MSRPPDIHIDDLTDPRLPDEVLAQQEAVKPLLDQLAFDADGVCAQASQETGLDDFGDPGFRERLDLLLRGFREEAGLSPLGLLSRHGLMVKHASNRLRIEDLIRRHPEILDVEVSRPIVIAGLPRTGTTHLHNLISADPGMRSLPFWESNEPVPPPDEAASPREPDPRIARCAEMLAPQDLLLPHFKAMHEMTPEHVHEEIDLLALDFSSMGFETLGRMPSWRAWYSQADQTPHYEYLKKVLKALQWQRGGTRWILKTSQHLEQLDPLLSTFPDVTVVFTHRDPASVVLSLATMITYSARLSDARVDAPAIGRYWCGRVKDQLEACVKERERVPAAQSLDVLFHEFMADDIATVGRIYELADQPLPESSLAALRHYMDAHPRGRFGRVVYDPANFEFDLPALREEFRFYTDRFGVRLES